MKIIGGCYCKKVRYEALDDPAQYGAPDMAFYCIEKQTFHYLPEELLKFDRFPD